VPRRFPAPWTVEQIPGGFKVVDANGQALAYIYARETKAQADTAKVLTLDRGACAQWATPEPFVGGSIAYAWTRA
jgi:hypothetical protein